MGRILFNANIHTLHPLAPIVEALAIQNGKVVACGTNQEILNLPFKHFTFEDMSGKTIYPGLTDAHIHLQLTARNIELVDCETSNKRDCLERIRARLALTPPGQWVLGHGWNQNNWPEGYGSREELDDLSKQHPIFLTAKSLHAAWVNSLALQIASLDDSSTDPAGGMLGRASDGRLNGILYESAYPIVDAVIPEQSMNQIAESLEKSQEKLWRLGITSVHDFDGVQSFQALQQLEREERLKMRVLKSIPHTYLEQALALALCSGFGSDKIKIGSLKLFADGALGPHTAAMLTPYQVSDQNVGVLLLTKDEILEIGKKASQTGISLAVHAIGDKANEEVLGAFSELRKYESQADLPHLKHRLEHAQLLNPDLIPLFASNRVTASVQPIHLISDRNMAERYWGARSQYAYAFGDLLTEKAELVFGSDSPVESPNPFVGMYAATTRLEMNATADINSWYPNQRISLQAALQAYTTNPANLAGWRNNRGRIHPGEDADLIVMEEDLFKISPVKIKDQLPLATMFAGEWVWQV